MALYRVGDLPLNELDSFPRLSINPSCFSFAKCLMMYCMVSPVASRIEVDVLLPRMISDRILLAFLLESSEQIAPNLSSSSRSTEISDSLEFCEERGSFRAFYLLCARPRKLDGAMIKKILDFVVTRAFTICFDPLLLEHIWSSLSGFGFECTGYCSKL